MRPSVEDGICDPGPDPGFGTNPPPVPCEGGGDCTTQIFWGNSYKLGNQCAGIHNTSGVAGVNYAILDCTALNGNAANNCAQSMRNFADNCSGPNEIPLMPVFETSIQAGSVYFEACCWVP